LCSIICCLGKRSSKFKSSKDGSAAAGCSLVDGAPASEKATPYKGKFLLPDPKPEDVNKKCIVIDLDETLVHSSFKVNVNHGSQKRSLRDYAARVFLEIIIIGLNLHVYVVLSYILYSSADRRDVLLSVIPDRVPFYIALEYI
jgi:hypothetical protein